MSVDAGSVLLMGDAAHATSPNLGIGMNISLQDAQVLSELMQQLDGDLTKVLPRYSQLRVKQGIALTDLSMCAILLDPAQQWWSEARMGLRSLAHKLTCGYVTKPVREFEGGKFLMSEMYQALMKQGLAGNRKKNDDLVRQYREYMCGLAVVNQSTEQAYKQFSDLITRNPRDLFAVDEGYAAKDFSEDADDISELTLTK